MHRLGMRGLVCAAVCLAMATTAMAQGQGQGRGGRGGRGGGFGGGFGGGGFGMSLSRIVGIEEVQKELKITDEQKTKLDAIRAEARQGGGGGGGGGFGNFQNMSEEERNKLFEEMRKQGEERNKKVEAVLNDDQNKRAKEILLQVRGNSALADPEVAKGLALTEDQVASVKTIGEESGKQMRELFQPGGGGDREEARKKMEELRKNTDEEYLNVLTDEQKAKFAAMKGAKFDIDPAALRGGFGGPGGGGGGRGGRRGGNNN